MRLPAIPLDQRQFFVTKTLTAMRQPVIAAAHRAREKIQPQQMLAQDAMQTMAGTRIEQSLTGKQLGRVLLHPEPGTHFQRQRQEHPLRPGCSACVKVEMVPKIAVRQILPALRLHHIVVGRIGLLEQLLQPRLFFGLRLIRLIKIKVIFQRFRQ